MMLSFEYDEKKSQTNKQKHGIDFEEAKELFENDDSIVIPAKIKDGEERFLLISLLDEKCYAVIFTIRANNIRIISARRCRKKEKELLCKR